MGYLLHPEHLPFGFIELTRLRGVPMGAVHCDQRSASHAAIRIFREDHNSIPVFVQMYRLPEGDDQLESDLALQLDDVDWNEPPSGGPLRLDIFPHDWSHRAFQIGDEEILHRYRGPDLAIWIRYADSSFDAPLLKQFNRNIRYLPGRWDTSLTGKWFSVHITKDEVDQPAIDSIDLRDEYRAIREMILDGIKRFAEEQRTPRGKLYQVPVTGVVIWLDAGNDYFAIHFDTTEVFGSGNYFSHPDYASVKSDQMGRFFDHSLDGNPVTLWRLDGSKITIPAGKEERIGVAFEVMAKELVKQLKSEDVFSQLLRTADMKIRLDCSGG
jgi:hypothetical protein